MGIFGIGFRIVLVAIAVLIERVDAFVRENPLLRSLLASASEGMGRDDRPD